MQPICTFAGALGGLALNQAPGEVCIKNEDCAGDEMCVHYWNEVVGECGFAPRPPSYCRNGDHDFSDFFGPDLMSICHH